MFLISLVLIGLIAIAIANEKELGNAEQTEAIPVRVNDK